MWTKAFRIIYSDGYTLDGAQFPQGVCVLADRVSGLKTAAISFDQLQLKEFSEGVKVEWDTTLREAEDALKILKESIHSLRDLVVAARDLATAREDEHDHVIAVVEAANTLPWAVLDILEIDGDEFVTTVVVDIAHRVDGEEWTAKCNRCGEESTTAMTLAGTQEIEAWAKDHRCER